MTSKTILFQGTQGSEVYNTLEKKAEAPTVINNDLNNSSAHFTVSNFDCQIFLFFWDKYLAIAPKKFHHFISKNETIRTV